MGGVLHSRPVRAAQLLGADPHDLLSQLAAKQAALADKDRRRPFEPSPAANNLKAKNTVGFDSSSPISPVQDQFAQRGDIGKSELNKNFGNLTNTPKSNPTVASVVQPANASEAGTVKTSYQIDPYTGMPIEEGIDSRKAAIGSGGALGAALLLANKSDIVARRRAKGVRDAYMYMANQGIQDKGALRDLNHELRLLGGKTRLPVAASQGVAKANIMQAERDLAKTIQGTRMKRLLPVAILGALAPNLVSKIQETVS